jgi:hypothetical protein
MITIIIKNFITAILLCLYANSILNWVIVLTFYFGEDYRGNRRYLRYKNFIEHIKDVYFCNNHKIYEHIISCVIFSFMFTLPIVVPIIIINIKNIINWLQVG